MAITSTDIDRIKRIKRQKRNYIEWYGMKRALLTYLGLPGFYPLKAHLQHGAGMIYRNDVPDPGVLKTKYKNVFLCNTYQKEICKKYLPEKDIYISGSIFPLYRQQKGITQSDKAQGTLFFTAHSTEMVEAYDNVEKTLEILDRLPDYLKPIKVSIYYIDLLRGLNEVYERNGYETYTNGHRQDTSFVDSFYKTLKSAKFAMGTTLGSQTYYAVEMGIPYFIVGDIPEYVNQGNEYYPDGAIKVKDRAKYGYAKLDQAYSLFIKNDFTSTVRITEEQKAFVMRSIGHNDRIPREELKKVVLRSAFSSYKS